MVSYLVIFSCCLILFKLPFIILGLLFRFAKPLSFIGFGCFVGITLTTGVPNTGITNTGVTNAAHHNSSNSSSNIELPDFEEFVSPAVLEAALSTAGELSGSVQQMVSNLQASWAQNTEKKITIARNSSGSDFRGIDRSLRKR